MSISRSLMLISASILIAMSCCACVVAYYFHCTSKELQRLSNAAGDSFTHAPLTDSALISVLSYADSMVGTSYDPLMGRFGDPLGKMGLVVCIDVPVRAYQDAGFSLPSRLREISAQNPSWFTIDANNSPSNPFFYRRVRNYYPLFQNDPLLEAGAKPQPGDWAFYGKTHIAIVSSVNPDGSYEVIEASPFKGSVDYSDDSYMAMTWGEPDFFGRLKRTD